MLRGQALISGGSYPSPTFTGTVTFPDGATWSATGITDAATYSTPSTPIANFTPVWNFSSTGNAIGPYLFGGTLTPVGASAGNLFFFDVAATLANSSANVALIQTVLGGVTISANYTGTVAAVRNIASNNPTNNSAIPIALFQGFYQGSISNGNGITSGSVVNVGLQVQPITAAAGVGGTISNFGIRANVPSSSAAGNLDIGIYITGNGGAASTKYGLYSDSTAPSILAGNLSQRGTVIQTQAAPAALTTSVTLTSAQIIAGLITGNQGGGAGATYTLPLGTDLGAAVPSTFTTNDSFDFSVVNISSNALEIITVVGNTGTTLVGGGAIAAIAATGLPSSGQFRVRQTSANNFSIYRIG